MKEVKCYVCNGIFWMNPQYRNFIIKQPYREKGHVAENTTKVRRFRRGLHCPYCGAALLDKVLRIA